MSKKPTKTYKLDDQVGFLLRKASQRNSEIFYAHTKVELTPTRWAAMAKLHEMGTLSQNELGRHTAMDVATIKGVVDRLRSRKLVETNPDPHDGRKQLVSLTPSGETLFRETVEAAHCVTSETFNGLSKEEISVFVALLKRIC